jgi:hypothetical protein
LWYFETVYPKMVLGSVIQDGIGQCHRELLVDGRPFALQSGTCPSEVLAHGCPYGCLAVGCMDVGCTDVGCMDVGCFGC